uniref:adenosylmethionine decarboxylase n=1 Tax=Entomoneis paludosa TaxID=265537 RepID=A0A7S2YHD0_9STRA|mmetsp:Transcript_32902/g.68574  ORF Transcript_32902/g.68574 Transcript_32902/m.68574 type:complete len:462 (+) Transcript_32902:338-1723(+)
MAPNFDETLYNTSESPSDIVGLTSNVLPDEGYRADPALASSILSSSDDESAQAIDRDYTGFFEGPEKTLEVVFRPIEDSQHAAVAPGQLTESISTNGEYPLVGLRRLARPDLDRICERARCTIISSVSNRFLDAYVLSESSLFVYPYMLVLKTCGTTTLLRCIKILIDLGHRLGLEIDWVGYSRKNFNFPGDQSFPHQSFQQELDYLYSHRSLCDRLDGNGYTLGPVTGDHWFVYVADHTTRKTSEFDTDRVLNIMMFDIDETVAQKFHYDQYKTGIEGESKDDEMNRISKEQTVKSGINELCPGAVIDPRAFEPCGYSMNAILFHSYSTIHITPEAGSSYASFETNQKVKSYKSLISNVIRTFRPKHFCLTLMADEGGLLEMKENPLTDSALDSKIVVPGSAKAGAGKKYPLLYKRSSMASIKVEDDCCCLMGNWVMDKKSENSQVHPLRASKSRGLSVS